jgi:hypothetical protein
VWRLKHFHDYVEISGSEKVFQFRFLVMNDSLSMTPHRKCIQTSGETSQYVGGPLGAPKGSGFLSKDEMPLKTPRPQAASCENNLNLQ